MMETLKTIQVTQLKDKTIYNIRTIKLIDIIRSFSVFKRHNNLIIVSFIGEKEIVDTRKLFDTYGSLKFKAICKTTNLRDKEHVYNVTHFSLRELLESQYATVLPSHLVRIQVLGTQYTIDTRSLFN